MSAKMKVHCSILPYVAKVNPTLHDIVVGTCTDRSIVGAKNKTGTTFIMPDNKELLSKIEKLAMSSNADDVQQAADIINAHVIRIPLRSATDWNSNKDNIPNSIYPSQRVEIDKATGDEVHFKSGAVAKLDKEFTQMMGKSDEPRRVLSVYRLIKGELPVTKDKPASPIKNSKSGGYAISEPVSSQTNRFKIAITVENDYLLNRLQKLADPTLAHTDVYADYTYGLVHYMLNNASCHDDLIQKVIPMMSCSNMDFYLLVEPHRKNTLMLLDDSVIDGWWTSKRKFSGSLSDLKAKLYALVQGRPEACYSKVQVVQSCIRDVRQSITVDRRIAEHITKLYDTFVSTNTIGDCADVLPSGLIDYYRANPGLKLVQDEARYIGHLMFEQIEKQQFSRSDYERLLNIIGDYLVERGRNKLMDKVSLASKIQPDHELNEAEIFIGSTAFMYINTLGIESDDKMVKNRPSEPTDALFAVFDTKEASHQRLYGNTTMSDSDLITALKSLNLSDVDALLSARGL